MKCEIIQDLIPSYIDGLTSDESNHEVEEHFKTCSNCAAICEQMKGEFHPDRSKLNSDEVKTAIRPFKKLNNRILQSVLITLAVCAFAVICYFYFFAIGWMVDSKDMEISYAVEDGALRINFELTDGMVLTAWSDRSSFPNSSFSFRECYSSVLDDRGEHPNQFSHGIQHFNEDESVRPFTEEDLVILKFKDKTEILHLKKIAEDMGLQ
ncbi:MAG: hypothetical protein K0Q48_611 [Bacillota bacterium]|nr:hypothetical protein [Bacillota bacterium]